MIARDIYLDQLIAGMGNGMIKVVTGIRRCGKSVLLMELFPKYLLEHGVDDSHIIDIALDDRTNKDLRSPDAILQYIRKRTAGKGKYYVLLDEVQLVDEFRDVMNSIQHLKNADLYVTGSNSHFLSSDIPTEFRGRSDQIRMWPLSFSEYYSGTGGDKRDAWRDYYTFGGLPATLALNTEKKKADYLKDLYETVYKKDMVERNKIKNTVEFEELVRVMASIIGSPCNPSKLSKTFSSKEQSKITNKTITDYLKYMANAFLIEKSARYDIRGRKHIGGLAKYYFSDVGVRNAVLEFNQQEPNHIMENILYNELRVRGYNVSTGKLEKKYTQEGKSIRKNLEVDFVAGSGNSRYYVQSAWSMPDEEKAQQESRPLNNIKDSFRKIIVTADDIKPQRGADGILIMNVIDFLLDKNSLDK